MGHSAFVLVLGVCAACGGPTTGGDDDTPPPPPPEARCDAPALVDTGAPTAVVGDGTPGSCTAAALATAAAGGGIVTFACGPDPVTIPVASQIVVAKETTLDGGGLVTLD